MKLNHIDYNEVFENRIKSYMYAIEKYPHVLSEEFENIINELYLQENDILLNIDGISSPINNYIKNIKINYQVIESNIHFCKYYQINPFDYNYIPFIDNSINKIMINASLHHVLNEHRNILYKEIYRVLNKNGLFLLNDVLLNSKEDYWLNVIVHKYNPNGHQGLFFTIHDKEELEKNGFHVITKIKKYKWFFYSKEELLDFVKKLFYLTLIQNDETLYNLIQKYLDLQYNNKKNIYYFDWSLLYFICTK